MTTSRDVRMLLERRNLRPNRRFGQNFLLGNQMRERIVDALELQPDDAVLEIGPGLGALTELLIDVAGSTVALEIDRGLAAHLEARFGDRLRLVIGDALHLDWESYMGGARYKVVSNLPYYIASALMVKILQSRAELAVLMMQAEVAERLAAPAGDANRGSLSVLVEYAASVEMIARVSKEQFYPQPRVDSRVVRLRRRSQPRSDLPWSRIEPVVRAAFRFRRKTLRRALQEAFGISGAEAAVALRAAGIDADRRGETLCVEEFDKLAKAITVGREHDVVSQSEQGPDGP